MLRPLSVLGFLLLAALAAAPAAPLAFAAAPTMTFSHHAAPFASGVPVAGEPSLGVNWNTGAVMYQAYTVTFRVTFNDATSPPTATWTSAKPATSVFNVDPILFTDSVAGRTFAGGLDGACSILAYSDFDGAGWVPMGNACASPSFDHPTIGSGPWRGGQPAYATYNRAVYYCAQAAAAQCAVSSDGGLTFGAAVPVQCGDVAPGLHGSVHVATNGVAYLPFSWCGSNNGVAVSTNNGLTWASRPIPGAAHPSAGFDPDVASTTSGWAYVAYPTSGYGVGVALTKDNGASWTNFGDVAAAAGVKSSTFHEMVAGDDNRAAVAYLGSTTDGNPHSSSFSGVWHVYVSYTLDGGSTWTTVRASDNVIQRGWICAGGTGCGSGRNLLDFIDAQVDATGRVVIAIADGCVDACETGSGASDDSWATIVRQTDGPRLFA